MSIKVSELSSLQRVLKTLGHKEPDRVPIFLLLTMHGAKELGLSIREYFSNSENVVKGQLLLREKYDNDCIYAFFYAGIEIEAWGGDVIFYEDGPPNSGKPFIREPEDINSVEPPNVKESSDLQKVLRAIKLLKDDIQDDVPIIGVVMSPFSLPVMQMGFNKYIELIYENRNLFDILMEKNQRFCIDWANAQLESGATAITYFDPVSSPTIIPKELYLKTGYEIAKKTLSEIKGPTATHFASGRTIEIIDEVKETGTAVIGVSALEDLSEVKTLCKNKLTILGNLNGIEMSHWTRNEAEAVIKDVIAKAGPGGGFILSDNHGEIPYQVPNNIIEVMSNAVKKYGKYPLK